MSSIAEPQYGQYDSETYESSNAPSRSRKDSNQLLMLPAPLAVNSRPPPLPTTTPSVSTNMSRSSTDENTSEIGSSHKLVSSPSPNNDYQDDYDSPSRPDFSPQATYVQQQPLIQSPTSQHPSHPVQQPGAFHERVVRAAGASGATLRQVPAASQYSGETFNPYGYHGTGGGYIDEPAQAFNPSEYDHSAPPPPPPKQPSSPAPAQTRAGRGFSLADNGPVPAPGSGGVRRVSRQQGRRPPSQAPPQNRYSRSSTLPPGAAPPQPGYSY